MRQEKKISKIMHMIEKNDCEWWILLWKMFFGGYRVLYGKHKRVSLSLLGGENVLTGFWKLPHSNLKFKW